MSHVLELKVSETCTWLEKVGLCSILVETVQLFLAPAKQVVNDNTDGFGKDA